MTHVKSLCYSVIIVDLVERGLIGGVEELMSEMKE